MMRQPVFVAAFSHFWFWKRYHHRFPISTVGKESFNGFK